MPSSSAHCVVRTEWTLAPPTAVYAVLLDVAAYPSWWPQVHGARQVDDHSGELRCRSLLPYDLVFVAFREVEDPDNGILRARIDGDLSGWSRWTIAGDGSGARALFDEDVIVRMPLVRAAGALARPVLRLNHDLMMRSGRKGLRRLLG